MRQDVENATYQIEYKDGKEEKRARNIKISLHPIASANPPLYYSGVDTIDAFCLSYLRKLTEVELDKAYDDFLVKKNETSDRVDASVDHNDIDFDIPLPSSKRQWFVMALILFLALVGGIVWGSQAAEGLSLEECETKYGYLTNIEQEDN